MCALRASGAKKGLLVYRMDARYRRRTPGVRDAFSITEEISTYSIKYLTFFVSSGVS